MGYKIIDGIAYRVEEINIDSIREEVQALLPRAEELNAKKEKLEHMINEQENQFVIQLNNYRKQIESLQSLIAATEQKRSELVQPLQSQLADCERELKEMVMPLEEKKEIITSLMVDEAKKLGL